MSDAAYLSLWLVLLLAGIAVLSALLTRRHRLLQASRRVQGERLLQALARYDDWVAQQRHAPGFRGESTEAAQALDEACTLRMTWFPELAADMAELLALHNRLLHFLSAQQALRLADAEAWLESEHDGRFVALWGQQRAAVLAMRQKLQLLYSVQVPPAGPASTFA
jgi:hypothetical protein